MISRELIKGTLRYLVLRLLLDNPKMYGYEITRVLDQKTSGRIKLTFAALYPVLHKLEAEGLVTTSTENVNNRTRKYYALSPKGEKTAREKMAEILEYLELMKQLMND